MKKFKGNKTREQVKAQCDALGLVFDARGYENGSDYTRIEGGGGWVLWASWNGKFFGVTDKGIVFDSDSDTHDGLPWFDALLAFFYV
jgi:hypothetical protein